MRIIIKFILYFFICSLFSFNNFQIADHGKNTDYFFKLIIPKIDLDVKVYNFNDSNNNVDKGIYLVKNYDFNTLNGSLILASHSGNSSISYFKNLHLLSINDIVVINYNYNFYYYEITDIYKINKNGKFKYSDINQGIYLITCDKKNDRKQLVFKGKLVKICKKSNF